MSYGIVVVGVIIGHTLHVHATHTVHQVYTYTSHIHITHTLRRVQDWKTMICRL